MKTIWKFPLSSDDETSVKMPKGAKILDVQVQRGIAVLWALVDTTAPSTRRRLMVKGTGNDCGDVPYHGEHVGTYQLLGGALVFHVFDLGEV